jgi:high-affinity Fe2+/Pb2+ permease
MNEKITSYQFDVYKETANFYLVIIMCMLFCGGIPALIPLGWINLWSRYITSRSLIQNSSKRI